MRTVVKWFGGGLLALAFVVSLFAMWLINTNSGLHFLLKRVPQVVEFGVLEGELGQFRVEALTIDYGAGDIRIGHAHVRWNIYGLLSRHLQIDTLELTQVDLKIVKSNTNADFRPWPGIELPLDISLGVATINEFEVANRGEQQPLFAFGAGTVSATYADDLLTIEVFKLESFAGSKDNRVVLQGRLDLAAKPQGLVELTHQLDWQLGQQKVNTSGAIKGVWRQLEITQNLLLPLQADLTATVTNGLSQQLSWDAILNTAPLSDQVIMGEDVSLGSGKLLINGQFRPSEGLAGLRASVIGDVSGGNPELSFWRIEADTEYLDDSLQVNRLTVNEVVNQSVERTTGIADLISVSAQGSIDKLQLFLQTAQRKVQSEATGGAIDLRGEWRSLRWPLTKVEAYFTADGKFAINGTSDDYVVNSTALGRISDKTLQAELSAKVGSQSLVLQRLRLSSGKSAVTADGKIDSALALNWNIDSPNLGDLIPGARGELYSQGAVSGARDAPEVVAQVRSDGLQALGVAIDALSVNANAKFDTGFKQPIKVTLSGKNLRLNQRLLATRLNASLAGTGLQHQLMLEVGLPRDALLSLSANGGIEQSNWTGLLTELTLMDPVLDTWSLNQEVELEFSQQAVRMSEACLTNQKQRLCSEVTQSPLGLMVKGIVADLNLSNLDRFIGVYDLTANGVANGQFEFQSAGQGTAPIFTAEVRSNDGKISWQRVNEDVLETEELVIRSLVMNLEQSDRLVLDGVLDMGEADQAWWKLEVDKPIGSADLQQAPLTGEVRLRIDDLAILPPSILNDINLNGRFDAQLNIGGSIAKPSLTMTADVQDSVAKIPSLGLTLKAINLEARSDGGTLVNLTGSLKSGAGSLGLKGALNLADINNLVIDLSIAGDDLQLANTADLIVTGDLDFTTRITPKLVDVKGRINIDRAELDFKIPDSAILASGDVVLQGSDQKTNEIKQRLDLSIELGENTHIQAQGLDAKLFGQLRVYQVPNGIIRGDGQIRLRDGRYTAYGQDLKLDQGRLIFNGGSIDDPSLELRAEKTVDAITAGVAVSGRASAPRLNLYSTPAMSDQDILSVLVFDKPINQLGAQDGLTLLRIASALRGDGQSTISRTTEKIQETLGLTELELQLAGDAPSIQAGKQLSSKFYVGYGYGLLDATQSLILKYKLSDAWSIKADVGADSGADLRYQLER